MFFLPTKAAPYLSPPWKSLCATSRRLAREEKSTGDDGSFSSSLGPLRAYFFFSNRPFPSCTKPPFQSEVKCKAIYMKMTFILFHKKVGKFLY